MIGETPDPKLVAGANQIVSEAVQAIAGSLIEGKLVYKDFVIALDEAGMREGLKEALLRKQGQLSFDENSGSTTSRSSIRNSRICRPTAMSQILLRSLSLTLY